MPLVDQRRRRLWIERLQHQVGDVVAPDGQPRQRRAVGARGDDQQHAGADAVARASTSSRSRDSGSSQCASSTTTATGPAAARAHAAAGAAGPPARSCAARPRTTPSGRCRGRDAEHRPEQRRAGHESRVERAHRGDDLRRRRSSTSRPSRSAQISRHAAYVAAWEAIGLASPVATSTPSATSSPTSSATSRDLPVPASAWTTTTWPLPPRPPPQVAQPGQLRVATDEGVEGRRGGGTVPGRPGAQGADRGPAWPGPSR